MRNAVLRAGLPHGGTGQEYHNRPCDFLKEKCIGCKQCVVACPWGSIRINHLGKEIIKCDHCSGDPACVKVCKAEALTYVEVEDVVSSKQQGVAQTYRRIAAEMAKGVNP